MRGKITSTCFLPPWSFVQLAAAGLAWSAAVLFSTQSLATTLAVAAPNLMKSRSPMSHFVLRDISESPEMTSTPLETLATARRMLIEICGPRTWHQTRQAWIARGASLLGWKYRRAAALFYREARRIDHDEYVQLETRLLDLEQKQAAREAHLHEIHSLRSRLDGTRDG